MDRIGKLNQFAEDHDIGVFYKNIPGIKSFSVPGAVVLDTDFMYHPGKEEVALAYGLGSCYYENFYTEKDSILDRRRAQVKNSKFTYQLVLTHDMIMAAVADGCTEPYAIAEHYNLPVIKHISGRRHIMSLQFYGNNFCIFHIIN